MLLVNESMPKTIGVTSCAEEPEASRPSGRKCETWKISSLIDWADGQAAAPAYEWPTLWFGLLG